MKIGERDTLNVEGSQRIAAKIIAYWKARGVTINITFGTAYHPRYNSQSMRVIRSDLRFVAPENEVQLKQHGRRLQHS